MSVFIHPKELKENYFKRREAAKRKGGGRGSNKKIKRANKSCEQEAAPGQELLGDRHYSRRSYAPLTLCALKQTFPGIQILPQSHLPPLPPPPPPQLTFCKLLSSKLLTESEQERPELGVGVAGAADQSYKEEGAEAKKGSSRRTGGDGGGILKLPRRGWGEQRIFPGRNGDRSSARGCFFLRSQTAGGDRSAGSRRKEGHAKPGRPSGAAGTKEADAPRPRLPAPAEARPAALLDRSPALAARNKVYVLLRPHPPPPTRDRASPRPPPPNCTRDPEHHPSLPASTTKRHTDRRG
ncbi:WAS/WASL-interacting protein family member 3-like [Hippopotamus amphibius kiboko]|uniref:WAS/WASL-interacting protein family member 3-like n=1 Tax=Hippopotamus amphibius kiboko TaxID=575201 RepID=UPI00259329E6|nr:WAS/WASL-interacting protein family member 3-like [Hippopotamus amphibius kiboko]